MQRRTVLLQVMGLLSLSSAGGAGPGPVSWGRTGTIHAAGRRAKATSHSFGRSILWGRGGQAGRIVGEGPSRVGVGRDPTAHAEMEAIQDAARRLGTPDLSGCELYSTARPCKMCEGVACWAGISHMYFGTEIRDAGAPKYPAC